MYNIKFTNVFLRFLFSDSCLVEDVFIISLFTYNNFAEAVSTRVLAGSSSCKYLTFSLSFVTSKILGLQKELILAYNDWRYNVFYAYTKL